jgi:hypothetical protein
MKELGVIEMLRLLSEVDYENEEKTTQQLDYIIQRIKQDYIANELYEQAKEVQIVQELTNSPYKDELDVD